MTGIITGASSGLGMEFAIQLTEKNTFSELWLIARRRERLEDLAYKLKDINPECSYRVLSLDLTKESDIERFEDLIESEKPEISWLINAAGMGKIGFNEDLSRKEIDDMILLNDKAAVDITTICIPYVVPKGHILEISSTAGFQPLTGLGVYSASKAFLTNYSRSLRFELSAQKITVTAVCPYWIKDTEFIPVAKEGADEKVVKHFFLAQKMHSVAKNAIRDAKIGFTVSTPGILPTIHHILAKFIPHSIMLLGWDLIRRI